MSDIVRRILEEGGGNIMEQRFERRRLLRGGLLVAGIAATGSLFTLLGCSTVAPSSTSTPSRTPTSAPPTQAPKAAVTETPKTTPKATETPKAPASGTSPLSVAEGDPSVEASDIKFIHEGATILGYQAKPLGAGPFPAILICHENRGLMDHFKDVARRFAKQGYVGLALDMLSREGGTASIPDEQERVQVQARAPQERHVSDFQAGHLYLLTLPFVDGKRIGMIGYCFGGGVTWRMAAQDPDLKATVAYYGPRPPLENVPDISAVVFGVYAAEDPRINMGGEELEAALKANNKTYQMKTYPGVQHAFFNDTGARYNEEQSLIAWKDTLEFLQKYLKG
jgi:carboxymethylenebutenolidase